MRCFSSCQNKNALELVPQQAYSHGKIPISSDVQTGTDWDLHGHHQGGLSGVVGKNLDTDEFGRYSPLTSRWVWSSGDWYYRLNVQITTFFFFLVGFVFVEISCWWQLVHEFLSKDVGFSLARMNSILGASYWLAIWFMFLYWSESYFSLLSEGW